MKVSLISLGCPKNLVDSEIILGHLAQEDYELSFHWQNSDVCIINTCAFLQSAVKEAETWIQKVIAYKKKGKIKKVIVAGCLVQRYKNLILDKYPEVDRIIGIDNLSAIGKVIQDHPVKISDNPNSLANYQTPRLISTNHYAYLKIADGCDNCCTYCLIPALRGRFRSRKIDDLRQEAQRLIQNKVKEIILIAQDTTLYGKDVYAELSLARLLSNLVKIKEIAWLRVLYTHPAHWTDELIQVYKDNPSICRYVDLPLQHISDNILKTMNRPYTRKQVEQLIDKLRTIPKIAIRTSLIVGFPNETEKDFEELLEFVREQKFAHLGCFTYSREPGTIAYALPNQIPEKIKRERLDLIMRTQQQISLARMQSFIGKELKVIIDSYSKSYYIGRTEFDAPEIDGVVKIKGRNLKIGDFAKVKISTAKPYELNAIAECS
ncbi:MAG: 30S ribosomal protein S12 methylthiotransferase RimO [candidate division WOR-3 bacterium]|nr:30S ribosomal protein S12 methylthiotransferase RimO [candidate division WOR-3 bacterium]